MKTAAEYRAMAEECLKWAREAQTSEVRASYSQLAQVWLGAASKLDGIPATQAAPNLTNAKELGEDGDRALETRPREDPKPAYNGGAMDKTIARLNIEHYRKSLATERDEAKRQTLMRLLAEEQAKVAALDPPKKKRRSP